jgi:ClpP class serine protease
LGILYAIKGYLMFNEEYLMIDKGWMDTYKNQVLKFEESKIDVEAVGLEERINSIMNPQILSFEGDTAVIEIDGATSQEGPSIWDALWGVKGVSYRAISNALIEADSKLSKTGKIKIRANTPGGGINGMEPIRKLISDISSRRSVDIEVGPMLASAGVYYTSAATSIIADGKLSSIGSVGVVVAFRDYSKMLENAGVKDVELTNPESQDKRPDLSTEKGQQVIIDRLKSIYAVTINDIIAGRGEKTSKEKIESIRGRVVVAEEALKLGLIDGIAGTIEPQNTETGPAAEAGLKGEHMDLIQAMNENPEIVAEVEKLKTEARDAGIAEMKAQNEANLKVATPFMTHESEVIRNTAAKVAAGELSADALTTLASSLDLIKEQTASAACKEESEEDGGTPPGPKIDAEQLLVDQENALIKARV